MPVEIEAKMHLRDVDATVTRLKEIDAQFGDELLETNTFFDTPDHTLKSSDQGLRLRIEDQAHGVGRDVIITHKGPRAHGQLKSRVETEVHVDDVDQAASLLSALGYDRQLSFQKRRQTWRLDHCIVAIDELPYLGQFIEIEGPSESAVLALRAKLGMEQVAIIRASYIAMLCSYMDEHNIHEDHVTFQGAGLTG